ncbi:hypothetical protein MRX96_055260 [Rhipicephalus microplus]
MMALIRSRQQAVVLKPALLRPRGESWVVSLSGGEEQKLLDHENGEELAELLVDEALFPPLDVGYAPPRDTGIRPRAGSDHARTPKPVVNPSPEDTTPPAGPANEADKGFPMNPTQPARGRSDLSRSRSPRAQNRPEDSVEVIPQGSDNIHRQETPMVSSDAHPREKYQRLSRTPMREGNRLAERPAKDPDASRRLMHTTAQARFRCPPPHLPSKQRPEIILMRNLAQVNPRRTPLSPRHRFETKGYSTPSCYVEHPRVP